MSELRYTLLSDGPSDQVLLPILTWLILQCDVKVAIQPQWADLWRLRHPPRTLTDRIVNSIKRYPCELLFVHRDAEAQPRADRVAEIRRALDVVPAATLPPAVCVVPVRMSEAWLFVDESALRRAAGNPHGRMRLEIPRPTEWETLPDPKQTLYNLLREASGLDGRRRRLFPVAERARRLTDLVMDYSPLRSLPAFQSLETDLRGIVNQESWDEPA